MNSQRLLGFAALALLAGFTCSCGGKSDSDLPLTGPAYALTTEGADEDIAEVLLEVLQSRMKPVRVVASGEEPIKLGTIHVAMRVSEKPGGTSQARAPSSPIARR